MRTPRGELPGAGEPHRALEDVFQPRRPEEPWGAVSAAEMDMWGIPVWGVSPCADGPAGPHPDWSASHGNRGSR